MGAVNSNSNQFGKWGKLVTEGERITLQEAFLRYRVPIATLRYWLDKQELTRHYDDRRRVVVDVAELEKRIAEYRPKTDPRTAA